MISHAASGVRSVVWPGPCSVGRGTKAVISPAALAVLAAAFAYGFAHTLTKRLSGTDSPMAILFYTTAIQLPVALLPAMPIIHTRRCGKLRSP